MHDVIIVGAGAAGPGPGRRAVPGRVRPRRAGTAATTQGSGAGQRSRRPDRGAAALPRGAGAARSRRFPGARGALLFGGTQLDLSHLAEPAYYALSIPQPVLERTLAEYAAELGVQLREATRLSTFAKTPR